jgi:hypothetical protein
MFDKVVVGIDDYQAGRDALELANQLVSPRGNLLLVYVEVLMRAPGPDSNPQWQLDDRRRALERLASVRDDAALDGELLTVQASSVARGLHEAVGRHGDLLGSAGRGATNSSTPSSATTPGRSCRTLGAQ